MELLDQLEAENPEDPSLAPKVRVQRQHMLGSHAQTQTACSSKLALMHIQPCFAHATAHAPCAG